MSKHTTHLQGLSRRSAFPCEFADACDAARFFRRSHGHIYVIGRLGVDPRVVKVGFSGDVVSRLRSLQCECPDDLELLYAFPGVAAHEELIHHIITPHWIRNEWFRWDHQLQTTFDVLKRDGFRAAAVQYKRFSNPDYQEEFLRDVVGTLHAPENRLIATWGVYRVGITDENKRVKAALDGAVIE